MKTKKVTFKPTNKATDEEIDTFEFGSSSLQGSILTSYKRLVELFGEPNVESDGYKTSSEWELVDEKGNLVTLYDYKATNLYGGDYPSVEEFRNQESYDWHIGAKNEEIANKLIEYLFSLGI